MARGAKDKRYTLRPTGASVQYDPPRPKLSPKEKAREKAQATMRRDERLRDQERGKLAAQVMTPLQAALSEARAYLQAFGTARDHDGLWGSEVLFDLVPQVEALIFDLLAAHHEPGAVWCPQCDGEIQPCSVVRRLLGIL